MFFITFFTYWFLFWVASIRNQTDTAPETADILRPRDHSDIENSCGDTPPSPSICSLVNEPVNWINSAEVLKIQSTMKRKQDKSGIWWLYLVSKTEIIILVLTVIITTKEYVTEDLWFIILYKTTY